MALTTNSHELAVLAEASYGPNPSLVVGDTEVFLTKLSTHHWAAAFTGTTHDGDDIITDMRVFPWYDRDLGWCHSGFLKTTRQIFDLLVMRLNAEHALQVTLTGHSLGGARAQVAAAMLYHRGEYMTADLEVVTFGSPKVFNEPHRAMCGIAQRRYVYGRDVVPRLPKGPWWNHYGSKIKLGTKGGPLTDHRIRNYVRALEP